MAKTDIAQQVRLGAGRRPALGFRDAAAKVGEQLLKAVLFDGRSEVVVRPVLRVGGPVGDGAGGDNRPLAPVVALADDAGRMDMLAGLAGQGEVFALAAVAFRPR